MSRRKHLLRVASCVLVSGALLLTGCNPGTPEAAPPVSDETNETNEPKEAEQTPTQTALAPKSYQRRLNEAATPLRKALARTGSAKNLPALTEQLRAAATAAAEAAERLGSLATPAEAEAAHDKLVAALDQLSADLGGIRSAVEDKKLCAAPAALSDLGNTRAFSDVPEAIAALRAEGYPVKLGNFKTPERKTRRLPNATMIREPNSDAPGTLEIDNGGDTDAVITLTSGKKPVLSVYVRKGGDVSTDGVPDGAYDVYFSIGEDWDGKTQSFTRNCGFQKFDDKVEFRTTATQYSINSLTLHQVIGGNASTSEVNPGDYPSR